uniref:DNA 3'-5' helicase n=1 Tax=Chromera velia CCMP2878 TaxID=1169474 RepID=A0A0G4I705_9ALVE|eukprot:Cvel_11556.t1-p1 / transcript=Cvel_11556.t1 / gene=Cvel_11556 / organism=Chromera_velia_CCMP2878 / gene_product=ATP-dependent DNA helicase hus2/rqh1, putative / transcript_product=ATP-dependent DNA helicase hus2/rqh1, putative / location=Cvel_scaffold730:16846-22589(-) / protein_length=485 / sequence_SO=supercontig / SO=protein_coding / is_pseudo=false
MEEFASRSSGAFPSMGRTEADPMEESFHLLANKLETGTYPDQTSFHLGEEGRPWFGDFPWSPQLQETLEGRFGFHSFKGLQLGPINTLLSGKDVIANFLTGGGKSLIFQFPAVFREGVALVISPLLSLMEDQKRALLAKGIPAMTLEGSTYEEEVKRLLDDLKLDSPATRVLYITPERCGSDTALRMVLQSLLCRSKLVVIGLDEAHLILIWGNDFRPDYKELKMLREWYPGVPMAAVTASATPEAQEEWLSDTIRVVVATVAFSLGIDNPACSFVFHYALPSTLDRLLEEANIPSNGVLGRCWRQNRKHGVQSLKRLMDVMVEDGYFAERGADTGRGNRYPILDSLTEKGWTALGLEVPVPPPEERAVPSAVPPSPQGGQETSRDSGPVVPPSPLGASSPPKRRKIDSESKEENVISEDENEYEDLDFVIENDENEYEDQKGQLEKKSAHAMGGNFDVFCLEHQGGLMNEEGELGFWQPNLPRY